jgi:hypothetical protein
MLQTLVWTCPEPLTCRTSSAVSSRAPARLSTLASFGFDIYFSFLSAIFFAYATALLSKRRRTGRDQHGIFVQADIYLAVITTTVSIKASSGMKGCAELGLDAPGTRNIFDFFGC